MPFDLIVTNSSGSAVTIDPERVPGASAIVVLDVENRGRDILPLVSLVNAGLLDAYHLILKVHTKRSDWREDHADLPGTGAAWRDRLLGDLLGDAANVRAIIDAFATTPDLGLVTGDGSLLHAEFWGDNQSVARTSSVAWSSSCDPTSSPSRPDRCTGSAASSSRGFVPST